MPFNKNKYIYRGSEKIKISFFITLKKTKYSALLSKRFDGVEEYINEFTYYPIWDWK